MQASHARRLRRFNSSILILRMAAVFVSVKTIDRSTTCPLDQHALVALLNT